MPNGKLQPRPLQQEVGARMEKAADAVAVVPRGQDRAAAALAHVEEGARKKKQPVGQLRRPLRLQLVEELPAVVLNPPLEARNDK